MPDIATLVYEVMQTEAPGQITRLVGLDLDGIVANGKTALAISLEGGARRDRQPVTLELIRAGARSLGSEPALPAICRSGVPELVLAFEARNPGELERDPHARRLLHVCRGDVAALTADPPDPAADPYPTLLFAIRTGSVAMVEALLRAGYRADPSWGGSPAAIAARMGHRDLLPLFAGDAPDPAILEDAIRKNDVARMEAWLASGTATAAHLALTFRLERAALADVILQQPAMPTGTASQLGELGRSMGRSPGSLHPERWQLRAERNGRILAKLAPHPEHDALIEAYLNWEEAGRVAMRALALVPGASKLSGPASEPCIAVGSRFVRLTKTGLRVEKCASPEDARARLPKAKAPARKASAGDAPKGVYAAELLRLGADFGPGLSELELTPLDLLMLARWPEDARYAHDEIPVTLTTATPHETRKNRWSIGLYSHYEELAIDGAKTPRVYVGDHETGRLEEHSKLIDFLRKTKRVGALD